jgi:hypothetical protein
MEEDDLIMFVVEHLKDHKGAQKLVEGLEPVRGSLSLFVEFFECPPFFSFFFPVVFGGFWCSFFVVKDGTICFFQPFSGYILLARFYLFRLFFYFTLFL